MLPEPYPRFVETLKAFVPQTRLISDPLRTLAYGTDASFYRLIPKLVVKSHSEAEVAQILKTAHAHDIAVTFRAAGTSLSGQAVTDAVLLVAGDTWTAHEILDSGQRIRLQPGVIGGEANRLLAPFQRKIGPDPASINAAMVGGIAANNASGMCCGTAQNSYQTVSSLKIVFADGSRLDTADEQSREAFRATHGAMLSEIAALGAAVRADTALAKRIGDKFKIKNTTGYSLNALVDFQDPFDIITHLMIGSEGTLGFIAEVVFDTVIEHPHKASSLMIFSDMEAACTAAATLKAEPVAAAELMDRASLRSVENKPVMPAYLKSLSPQATALLVETRAGDPDTLQQQIVTIQKALGRLPVERPITFSDQEAEYSRLWDIRKGLFPAVGAVRRTGTTVIIEDVAFPIARLAPATLELQQLMEAYRYHEAIIFGHSLEGNLHFVFPQDFGVPAEVERYRQFMDAVCSMVVERYDGSLKAEHGTGRNMAPYVELEWGQDAYRLMERIKQIFDPKNLLNPGVILNADPQIHVKNLKPMPPTDPTVDKCTECGFCECACPSRTLTLTPRQRVVIRREISRLQAAGEDQQRRQQLEADYVYLGEQTCATDGLCALSCPVEINTGDLTKALRRLAARKPRIQRAANWIAGHYDTTGSALSAGLWAANGVHRALGTATMQRLADSARRLSGNRLPLWNPYMPRGVCHQTGYRAAAGGKHPVVYFPACIARRMGPAAGDPDQEPLADVTVRLLQRAGFDVLFPTGMAALCCGMAFESKGLIDQADQKARELERALLRVSRQGEYPILCDTSPCLYRMQQVMDPRLKLHEPADFAHKFLVDRLTISPLADTVAVHATCSDRKMGLAPLLSAVARSCAAQVVAPAQVGCCGFAGDRGFHFPELNAAALGELRPALGDACSAGYSTSRTCEIGLSLHSGIYYKSIFYLLERCSR